MKQTIIRVTSPSRLHITLIDMQGTFSGRVDGGAGITISKPEISLSAQCHDNIRVECGDGAKLAPEFKTEIENALIKMRSNFNLSGIAVRFEKLIPAHSGFGSKTQTLLSTLAAYARLYGIEEMPRTLANIAGRGGTSGIGVEVFTAGGFVVDCGHTFSSKGQNFAPSSRSKTVGPAPLIGRYQFPDWPVLIVTPAKRRKIHGAKEQRLFKEVCPIPLADAQACSHVVLMMLIPAIIEADITTFCKGINLIQNLAWKKFEIDAQTKNVRETMDFLRRIGIDGIGMSSWGSTIFGLGTGLADNDFASHTLQQVQLFLSTRGGGTCFITNGSNNGASIGPRES